MLYPKIYIKKKKRIIVSKIKELKEDLKNFIKSFRNFKEFLKFLEKKLHF